jgi:hypothetical protein
MAWLVGGVWTADAAKLGPGMQRIETRYLMVGQWQLHPFHNAFRDG